MRHSSIATTQAYVHLAHDARREALARIASLIPPSVVPLVRRARAQDQAENMGDAGALPAVDIHPAMDDVSSKYGAA